MEDYFVNIDKTLVKCGWNYRIIWLHHCYLLNFNPLNFLGLSSCTTEDASGILTMKVVLVVTILFGATKFLVEGAKKMKVIYMNKYFGSATNK